LLRNLIFMLLPTRTEEIYDEVWQQVGEPVESGPQYRPPGDEPVAMPVEQSGAGEGSL
jgi:hypothetical protein